MTIAIKYVYSALIFAFGLNAHLNKPMPIISRKDFAELCGSDEKKLNVYIQRGKVSVYPTNKKLVDTDNPLNAAFMSDKKRENELKGIEPVSVKTPKVTIPKKERVEKPVISKKETTEKSSVKLHNDPIEPKDIQRQVATQTARDMKRVDQEMEKKAKELELIDLRIQREQLLLNKSAGQLLPIDLVTGIVTRHASAIFKNFEKGCVNIASIFSSSDQKIYVKVLEDLKVELSRCVSAAGDQADAEVEILVTEFSQTLLRGQKKV